MKIFPAIDLREGKAVRLIQGDYEKMTVYSDSPLDVAERFLKLGAKHLHIVDLDGALCGKPVNSELIKKIAVKTGMEIQVGGGIRDEDRIKYYLDAGVSRVILGTAAIENREFLEKSVAKYGNKIAVGVDSKDGKAATNGWKKITGIDSINFVEQLAKTGVNTIVFTDISKDGLLSGTNMDIYRKLKKKEINIIASGGITYIDELKELAQIGIYGAILGKALYAGKIDLSKAITTAEE